MPTVPAMQPNKATVTVARPLYHQSSECVDRHASGADFGASVYVLITVTTAYTSTPTATEESTSTLTPTVEAYP